MDKCAVCGSNHNLHFEYEGDYYCRNNRCLNRLFCILVGDECIRVDDDNKASTYDEYYNSEGKFIGDDTCTNISIIRQVTEVNKYKGDK
ncbi:hypothetical protein [Peptostreptococcus equinus]|uniref:Uncharacterized protein n=1 Tax=Peptostreptococcus equinus TaxID=3003601 RepID=A0ABY7JPH7_9FIRM|nr:hypothetical protein [Peptostreptococcus sp. CBA3647]WAW14624.1 hypothetical protein O0R46_08475 [Peptostreptococcus sp. CBA3647]WAW15265.1 hypothetical protein O0R46_02100 [Peptostreptococcus sp. CBA3647]